MNVYDFDETVFTGDSEDHFFAYLEKKPGFRLVNWKYKCYNFLVNSKLMTKQRRVSTSMPSSSGWKISSRRSKITGIRRSSL